MRIVAGTAKGRELRFPRTDKTRPTSDKVREAIFNVIGDIVDGATVLDLFAGSGALAIEALSRGAERAELVESGREACDVIRHNLRLTGFEKQSTLWPMPVERALDKLGTTFDVIFADPPYEMVGIEELMKSVTRADILGARGHVVLEHGKRIESEVSYGSLVRWQQKRYGDTMVSFYEFQESEP